MVLLTNRATRLTNVSMLDVVSVEQWVLVHYDVLSPCVVYLLNARDLWFGQSFPDRIHNS